MAEKHAPSYYRDEVKDALWRRARSCSVTNGIVSAEPPSRWTGDRIRSLRDSLYVSQTIFAAILGVSPSCVRAWENNQNEPTGAAARLLDIINRNPDVLVDCAVVKINPEGKGGRS